MTQEDPDLLARAVEQRREAELRRLARVRAEREAHDRRREARREALDADRERLAALARLADPILHDWVEHRLDLALRAYPDSERRSVDLPPLIITSAGAHFRSELEKHERPRGGKRYVVFVGPELSFRWSASGLGGAGGGPLPIHPRSFAALAEMDLTRALGDSAEWQEPDVLAVALRVAEAVRDGELEGLVAEAMVGDTA
jgi:hypothetical protein